MNKKYVSAPGGYKNLEIKIKKKLNGDFLGSFKSAFKGLGIEFDSLREYIPGDSIKSIDWKTTAKMGEVFVKSYEEEKDLKILFVIDNSESLKFGSEKNTKKETLEEVFFLLSNASILSGFSVGTLINNEFIDFKKSEESIIRTLRQLDNKEIKENNLLEKLNIKNTLIFYISENLEPNLSKLKYLNQRNEIVYINIFDYFENNLSTDNFEINISGKGFINFLLGKNDKVNKYINLRKSKIENLKKILRKQKIEYLNIDDRDDLFLKFYKFFNSYTN